jgi:TonB family protein
MKRNLTFVAILLLLVFAASAAWSQAKPAAKPDAKAAAAEINAIPLTDDLTQPVLTEVASPDYTAEAKKKKIEGQVTLSIVIDRKGDVVEAKVVKGLGYGLDENAILAVKEYKYKPAMKNDEPVAVRTQVTVDFYIH